MMQATPESSSAEYGYVTGQFRASFPALFETFAAANAAALGVGEWTLDVRYGPAPRETFDVCQPGAPAWATVVYLHAGYWQSRDKSQFRFLAPALVEAGLDVCLVNYPLAPEASIAAIVRAVKRAVAAAPSALRPDNAGRPLILAGHSAGAHLAVELALDDTLRLPIAGVVAISGVYDLRPLVQTSLNHRLQLSEDEALARSPLFRVAGGKPPGLFMVGADETPAFLAQNRSMADAWSARGNSSMPKQVDGADHFTVLYALRQPWLVDTLRAWVAGLDAASR